jgi:hypothetical protein
MDASASTGRTTFIVVSALALTGVACFGNGIVQDQSADGGTAPTAPTAGTTGTAGAGGAAKAGRTTGSGGGGAAGAGRVGAAGVGSAAAGAAGIAGASALGGASGATGAMVNPVPGQGFFVGANLWNIDWEGSSDYFQSGVDFATTTDPWLPQFLDDLAPYRVLRFMDWNQTNVSNNSQAVWSTRKQKTAPQNEPVAFEWQIDLCNRTMKDYWLNVPHEATPAYWQQLAQLVQSQLNPALRVYVEWSNEVWNGGFPQNGYAAAQAQALGLAGSIPAASYYVYEAVRLFETFEGVFGKGSPRVVKVLAGQVVYNGPCLAHAAALGNSTINPNRTKPDIYAVAPYLDGTSIAGLTSAISGLAGLIQTNMSCSNQIGVPLVSYEGGSDSSSSSSCQTVQVDPGMHDVYTSYLDGLATGGMSGPFMQYTSSGSCWGLKVATTDAISAAPKYKGVVDWVAAHP